MLIWLSTGQHLEPPRKWSSGNLLEIIWIRVIEVEGPPFFNVHGTIPEMGLWADKKEKAVSAVQLADWTQCHQLLHALPPCLLHHLD